MSRNATPMRVTLLGTGTSTGVPVIGCRCHVCSSEDARDQRLRCACFVETDGIRIIIDTGPDFRRQMLREHITRIDTILFTHHHFDHVVGVDDLRPYFFDNRAPMACYAHPDTARVLRCMFPYIFERDGSYLSVPRLELHEVREAFEVSSRYETRPCVRVVPLALNHGKTSVLGYRIGDFAYLTDTNDIPADTFDQLKSLDVLVIDGLRHESHPRHFTIGEAVEAATRIGARQTYLVHITHTILHAEEDPKLPIGIALGYDGLRFDVGAT